ncbi:MAG: cadherin domain-containing protein, partial [Planctomycetota bacterium]
MAGDLDITFDGDGKVTTAVESFDDTARSVAIQSDGKIVVAGTSYIWGNAYDFALTRYNSDGSLDTTFDGDGKVTTNLGSSHDEANSLAIQSDGKIVVAGYSYAGSLADFALARYNSDGSMDTTFDGDGKVTTAVGSFDDTARSLAIQSDGKIVVAGSSHNGSNWDFALVLYNSNGSLDTTFDFDGKVTTAVGSSFDYAYSVAIQSDGKIVVAGRILNGSNWDFALTRYNSDGSLDTTFDGDGKVTTDVGSSDDEANSLAIQSDGKIVVAGCSNNGIYWDFALTRYNSEFNRNPTDISLSSNSISENAGANATVGTLSTTDPDAGNSFTYTLVVGSGDADNGSFNINGNSLRATSSFDFETKSSYTIRIRSTDQGGLFTEKVFTITVINVNETPTDISLSSSSIAENAGANAVVGALSTTDVDAGNTF